jgi:hypothetical protein
MYITLHTEKKSNKCVRKCKLLYYFLIRARNLHFLTHLLDLFPTVYCDMHAVCYVTCLYLFGLQFDGNAIIIKLITNTVM